jgi:hypothetical protein
VGERRIEGNARSGLEPLVTEMTACFPDVPPGIAINTEKISSSADVAVVKGNVSELGIKQIALADGRRSQSRHHLPRTPRPAATIP